MNTIDELPPMELVQAQQVEEYDFKGPEEVKPRKEKKPKKEPKSITFVRKLNNDSIGQLMNDIIEENNILKRQVESLRIQLNNIQKEYNEFRNEILKDRMINLGLIN